MHATSEESLRLRSQSGIKDLTGVEQTVVVVKHKKRLGRIRTFVPLLAWGREKKPDGAVKRRMPAVVLLYSSRIPAVFGGVGAVLSPYCIFRL